MTGGRVVERAAARLVRLPMTIAAIVALLVVLDAAGVPGTMLAGRAGVRSLLATYLLAGVMNLPRFPRTLRGPPTPRCADRLLLDLWSVLALFATAAVAVAGTTRGLL